MEHVSGNFRWTVGQSILPDTIVIPIVTNFEILLQHFGTYICDTQRISQKEH